jgi:chromosome segregation ATPase
MNRITSTFERLHGEKELRQHGYMNRAQEIKAQIKRIETKLQEVETECSHKESSLQRTIHDLDGHRVHNNEVTTIRGQLELLSSQDRDQLIQADKIMDQVKPDESGLSARARSLRDFLMACPPFG